MNLLQAINLVTHYLCGKPALSEGAEAARHRLLCQALKDHLGEEQWAGLAGWLDVPVTSFQRKRALRRRVCRAIRRERQRRLACLGQRHPFHSRQQSYPA